MAITEKQWSGQDHDQESVAELFAQKFHRGIQSRESDYFQASEDDRFAEYCRMAKVQKMHVSAADARKMDKMELLRLILSPGALSRFNQWFKWVQETDPPFDDIIFDIDHNPGSKGSSAGPDWPLQLRHGSTVSMKRGAGWDWDASSWRIATAMEHLEALGRHACTSIASPYTRSPLLE